MRRAAVLLALFVSGVVAAWAADSDISGEVDGFSKMYIAPMDGGADFWRLYHPGLGCMVEFRRRGSVLVGAAGWSATMEGDDVIAVRPPSSQSVYRFRNGRPEVLEAGGRKIKMKFEEEPVITGGIAKMWEGAEEEARAFFLKKWPGRFAPLYGNPNKSVVLLASIFLVCVWAFLYFDKLAVSVLGLVGCAAFGWLTFKTGARGGAIGAVVGVIALWGLRFVRKGGRWRLAATGLLGVASVVFLLLGGSMGRLTAGTGGRGDAWRRETWQATPRMMVDAPWGWPMTSGRAYSDWYQPPGSNYVTPTLTSDHLTRMVGFGWAGRFLWAFGWLALAVVFGRAVFKGGSPLPLALFLSLGVSAVFNPILHDWTLWLIPVASAGLFAFHGPWRDWRAYRLPAAVAAVLSVSVCVAFWLCGRDASAAAKPPIHSDGKVVTVGSMAPDSWIVDDRTTIGWLFAPKDIRAFYGLYPDAPAIGYAESVEAVPDRVRRLSVAGCRCREYIRLWRKGKAPKADELVFLSPSMPLNEIPLRLRKSCRFRMVVGEFAARYADVYGHASPSDEFVVVKGAEAYVPTWMHYALGLR